MSAEDQAGALALDLIHAKHAENPNAPFPMVRAGCALPLAEALIALGWRRCPRNDSSAIPSERNLGWWVMSGGDFLFALRRAANGEDPDLIYAEQYANSEIEHVDGEEDGNGGC